MSLKIDKPLVSIDWLNAHLDAEQLIILDCTIPKVSLNTSISEEKTQIKGAVYFDIKNSFSDNKSAFPNTVLSPEVFEERVQKIGIQQDAIVVCYDTLGTYSSPRVWWMFQLMGFKNVVVLDGGLPAWKASGFPVEKAKVKQLKRGNFKVTYQPRKLKYTVDVFESINNKEVLIVDARSNSRFNGTKPEPRKDLKSGHIPSSVNLPFIDIQDNGKMKTETELTTIFNTFKNKKEIIFTCGSGITAAILALGAAIVELDNVAVYDSSWTEWANTKHLPISL